MSDITEDQKRFLEEHNIRLRLKELVVKLLLDRPDDVDGFCSRHFLPSEGVATKGKAPKVKFTTDAAGKKVRISQMTDEQRQKRDAQKIPGKHNGKTKEQSKADQLAKKERKLAVAEVQLRAKEQARLSDGILWDKIGREMRDKNGDKLAEKISKNKNFGNKHLSGNNDVKKVLDVMQKVFVHEEKLPNLQEDSIVNDSIVMTKNAMAYWGTPLSSNGGKIGRHLVRHPKFTFSDSAKTSGVGVHFRESAKAHIVRLLQSGKLSGFYATECLRNQVSASYDEDWDRVFVAQGTPCHLFHQACAYGVEPSDQPSSQEEIDKFLTQAKDKTVQSVRAVLDDGSIQNNLGVEWADENQNNKDWDLANMWKSPGARPVPPTTALPSPWNGAKKFQGLYLNLPFEGRQVLVGYCGVMLDATLKAGKVDESKHVGWYSVVSLTRLAHFWSGNHKGEKKDTPK